MSVCIACDIQILEQVTWLSYDGQSLIITDPMENNMAEFLHFLQGGVEVAVVHKNLEHDKMIESSNLTCLYIWQKYECI